MSSTALPSGALTQPWRLPSSGLALFEGDSDAPRLSHYFLPCLILSGSSVLLQFPWSFKNNPENRQYVAELCKQFREYPLVCHHRDNKGADFLSILGAGC